MPLDVAVGRRRDREPLRIALALGYLDDVRVAPALALIDRVRAMTFRLSRP